MRSQNQPMLELAEGVVELATPSSSVPGFGLSVAWHGRPAPSRRLPRRVWLVRVSHLRPCVLQHSSPRCSHHLGRRAPRIDDLAGKVRLGTAPCTGAGREARPGFLG